MRIALDFGTCNTILTRWNEADDAVEVIREKGLSRSYSYRMDPNQPEETAWVIPSLIHFGDGDQTLLGSRVEEDGLVNHPGTFRWIKLDMLRDNRKTRRVNGNLISLRQAATRLLKDLLLFTTESMTGRGDELIITVPVEAYDHYVEWLRKSVAVSFPGAIRMLDEATACILGYQKAIQSGSRYMIFDFGGGTLDVSIVRVDLEAEGPRKCKVLGRAGEEIGGMMVDQWMLEHVASAEGLTRQDMADVGLALLLEVEKAKIALSGGAQSADILHLNDMTGAMISHTFTQQALANLLNQKGFYQMVGQTVSRALEMAYNQYQVTPFDLLGVFMVGGTSLLHGVAPTVRTMFPNKDVRCDNPFEAVARGACRYAGEDFDPTLVHDYCLRGWNRDRKAFELVPVIEKGTKYPTPAGRPACAKYISTACSGAPTLGLVIHERSEMIRPEGRWIQGSNGRMQYMEEGECSVDNVRELNPDDKEFIHAVPLCEEDQKHRFVAGFAVDEHKRLTLSLKDTLEGNKSYVLTRNGERIELPLRDFPMVRL